MAIDYGGIASIIVSAATLVTALGSFISSIMNRRKLDNEIKPQIRDAKHEIANVSMKVDAVSTQTNGIATGLRQDAYDRGVADGKSPEAGSVEQAQTEKDRRG